MEEPTGGAALHGEPRGHFLTLTAVLHERARTPCPDPSDLLKPATISESSAPTRGGFRTR